MHRSIASLGLAALAALLSGCGTLTVGPQVRSTASVARYTDSFDAAAPDGAAYGRPAVTVGLTGSLGFWQRFEDADDGGIGLIGVSYVEASDKLEANATVPDGNGVPVETLSLSTRDRGLELLVGLSPVRGPIGGVAVVRRSVNAQRSGLYGGSFEGARTLVLRPEIGVHLTSDAAGLVALVGYEVPVWRNRAVLAGSFDPTRADLGDDPIGAGQSGPVASVRVHF